MILRLRKESMQTAIGCFLACGFLQLTGALLAVVNAGALA